jgi:DHA3 family macrolide efflux protein-like MFS transporter
MNFKNKNLRTFYVLLFGQSISLLGTGMTRFAVMIWAYEQTQSATALAMLGFFNCVTYIAASPFAGVLVDRWSRKRIMFFADLSAGLTTVFLLFTNLTGSLHLWHLYLTIGLAGIFEAFQEPAFNSTVSLVVPKDDYTRANGSLGLGRSMARMFAPVFAGLFQQTVGLNVVLGIDLFTMALALYGLFIIHIPTVQSEVKPSENFWGELRFGLDYIFKNAGLRNLTLSFFLVNLFATLTYFAILSPMILARSGGDETALGIVRLAMGVGGILGGVWIIAWKNPQKKARMYLIATGLSFLICDVSMAMSDSVVGWSVAGFLAEVTIPLIVSPYFALWQELVPNQIQGRVFSTREMIQIGSQPIGYLLGGLLADNLFEPAMLNSAWVQHSFGLLVGTGPGAGMSSMFLFTAFFGGLLGFGGLLSKSIRQLDR